MSTEPKTEIAFSPDLALPIASAVTQKFAFLGISGSGKTYGAGKLVEGLCEARAQVVVIDNVGNWYGLRLAADGKRPGIAIPVLGGERGDVALDATAGKLAAETVAESKASMILDVSDFTAGELRRFVTDFATSLLALKKRSKSPVMVVWEECQDIVPQRVFGEDAKMVGAVERLIKKGRNYGVGTTLISQRAAAVNKDVLNQIETLFAFRAVATQDRKAIRDWVVDHARDVAALVDELPSLPTGTCYCWSPQWLQVLDKVRVGKKRTFDASATPDLNDAAVTAGALAPVDLERFKKRMGEAIERARASDPSELRKRIATLETQLAKQPIAAAPTKTKVVERHVMKDGQLNALSTLLDRGEALVKQACIVAEKMSVQMQQMRIAIDKTREPAPQPAPVITRQQPPPRDARAQAPNASAYAAGDIGGPERRVLGALAWFEAIGVSTPSAVPVAFLAGYSSGSSSFERARGVLRSAGLVEIPGGGLLQLTEAGRQIAPASDVPAHGPGLREAVLAKLGGPERRLLQPLIDHYPGMLTSARLAEAAGYAADSSSFERARGVLRSFGLATIPSSGHVRAADLLFPEVPRG